LEEKNEKISQLEGEVVCLRREVSDLSSRLEDVEGYQRGDTLIFSGREIPEERDGEDCKQIISNICKDKIKLITPITEISSSYRIGKKSISQNPVNRNILVKFSNQQIRNYVLSGCKSVKPANIFTNEYLTPQRAKLLAMLKKLKRAAPQYISAVSSRNGRIFAWCKSHNGSSRDTKKFFSSMKDLDGYAEALNISMSDVSDNN